MKRLGEILLTGSVLCWFVYHLGLEMRRFYDLTLGLLFLAGLAVLVLIGFQLAA